MESHASRPPYLWPTCYDAHAFTTVFGYIAFSCGCTALASLPTNRKRALLPMYHVTLVLALHTRTQ